MKRKKLLLFAPLAIVGFAAFAALGGYIVMQLWNWLLPSLFGWRLITFWQALGLLVLCRLLFGGFGMHGRSRMGHRMTPEERERMRQRMCGGGKPFSTEAQSSQS